jgi:hypothetical protein
MSSRENTNLLIAERASETPPDFRFDRLEKVDGSQKSRGCQDSPHIR